MTGIEGWKEEGRDNRMKREDKTEKKRLEEMVSMRWIEIAALLVAGCLFIKYSDTIFAKGDLVISAVKPLALGFAVAYVLNIFMKRLETLYFPKRTDAWVARTRRPVCVFSSVILVLLIVTFLIVLVVPSLLESVQVLTRDIPRSFMRFQRWLIKVLEDVPEIQEYVRSVQINWNSLFERMGDMLQKGIGSLFNSAFSMANLMVSSAFTTIVSVIFAIYMLFGKERLKGQAEKLAAAYVPEKVCGPLVRFLRLANETFTNFITGQITEAFILGTLCGVGMVVLRLPYALMTGVIVGATALIPVIGAYAGAFVGAFLIVTVSPLKAVEFVIYLSILQQIEGNLIYPRVVGSSIGLPGIWVLAAVTIGGGLLGIPGMLIGVPLTATLYKWIRIDVNLKLRRKEQD